MPMEITFHVCNFDAQFDEQIFITGSLPELGEDCRKNAIPLIFTHKNQYITVKVNSYESGVYQYFTSLKDDVLTRQLPPYLEDKSVTLNDEFKLNKQTPWFSSVFEVIAQKSSSPSQISKITDENQIAIQLFVPYPVDSVQLIGSAEATNNWQKRFDLTHIGHRWYELILAIPQSQQQTFAYKFLVNNSIYDAAPNRTLCQISIKNQFSTPINVFTQIFSSENNLNPRFTGVNLPIFSLRSQDSIGCGEFADLKIFSEWAKKSGIRVVQIIPVNDTMSQNDARDAQPYNGISVFGMHPMYIRVQDVEGADKFKLEIDAGKKRCEGEKMAMDYEGVVDVKMSILRKIWAQNWKKASVELEKWVLSKNVNYWIFGYSVFKYLHEVNGTTNYHEWAKSELYNPSSFMKMNMADKQKCIKDMFYNKKFQEKIWFYTFIQYNLDKQLHEAAEYSRKNGVFLKGDIPIGVHPLSVDTWERTELFNMDTSTGAPPDQFSATGQNWDFPTYNWDKMQEDGNFEWWTVRFQAMERYFDSFRIDHVLGWFRIWEIPGDCCKGNGRLGHFAPCDPISWQTLENLGIWDRERLTRPFIHKEHVVPELVSQQDFEFLLQNQILIQDLQFGGFKLNFTERESVNKIDKLQLAKEDFERIKESIILLSSNRCMTADRLIPGQFCHPIFCNIKEKMETISFKLLPEEWKKQLRIIAEDYFYKAHQETWAKSASIRLPIISKASQMLIIGEDLGLLAPIVPQKMKEFGLLGFRVHNMPSDPKQNFQKNENYNWMTICTPGTHDCPTIRYWWDDNKKQVELYWKECFNRTGDDWKQPISTLDSLNIVRKHLHTKSMIAMFLWQDWTAISDKTRHQGDLIEENINNPSVSDWYWRYRMPENIEDYIKNEEFCQLVKQEIYNSGRM